MCLYLVCCVLVSCVTKNKESSNIKITKSSIKGTTGLLDSLRTEIIKTPNKAQNYFLRSKIYLENGENQMALGDLERAVNLDSLNVEYNFELAKANYEVGNSDRALEGFRRCLELDPNHEPSLLKLAKIFLVFKHYDTTIQYLNRALKNNEFLAEAYYIKGVLFKENGDTVKAASSFQTAREVKPDFYEASIELGLLYASAHNKLALEFYNDALRIAPKSIEALYNKAMFYQNTKEIEKAITCYWEIIEIDSLYYSAYYNLGFINLVYNDKLDSAIFCFSKVIQLSPKHHQAYYNRGYAMELQKNVNEAVNDYKKALEINPTFDLAAKGLSRLGL